MSGKGVYGPFDDGSSIPYVELAAPDGSAIGRALPIDGVDVSKVPPFAPIRVRLGLDRRDDFKPGMFRLRLVGIKGREGQ